MRRPTAVLVLVLSGAPLTASCGGGAAINRTIDDATTTTRVKTALLNDPQLTAPQIDVDTAAGVVTLSGIVKSKDEEARAIAIARQVNGVRDVKSLLKVQ